MSEHRSATENALRMPGPNGGGSGTSDTLGSDRDDIPEPRRDFGTGYLFHYDPSYQDFSRRLEATGATVDIHEILGVQYNSDPAAAGRLARQLGTPITLHSFEYRLGDVDRPPTKVVERIQSIARNANASYIGEHIAIMGTADLYCGGFLQPPGTDEQTEVLVQNVIAARTSSVCPIIVENPSQFYNQIGAISIGAQLREVSLRADVGILLSLSNVSISERFHPQDRDEFFAQIPLRRVRQIHALCGNRAEELQPGMEKTRQEHEWIVRMLQELAREPECRPASVVFELESGTPSLPEPERLRDYLEMARDLFFSERLVRAGR